MPLVHGLSRVFPSPSPCPPPFQKTSSGQSGDRARRRLHHGERSGADRHGPEQRGPDALPEAAHALGAPRLREAVAHGLVPHLLAEPVRLHLALDDVERVAGEPEGLARQPAVQRHLVGGDLGALQLVARRVRVHQVLERQEPHAVRRGLAVDGHGLAAVQAPQHALVRGQLAHAVQRPRVQARGPVRLRLQPDAHVLDRARDHRVGHARERARRVVLAVAQLLGGTAGGKRVRGVRALEVPPRPPERAELDRHARADADERRQRALVEGERAFLGVDRARGVQGGAVRRGRLQTHFDDVEGLAWKLLINGIYTWLFIFEEWYWSKRLARGKTRLHDS